jgi:Zn-dependent protease
MAESSWLVPSWSRLLILPGLIAGFTVHELAHAIVAYRLRDVSQVERGRITLNPLRHIAWLGLLAFLLFGFGWAKPVRMDPKYFKNRYLGVFLVCMAGSLANLTMVAVFALVTLVLAVFVAILSQQSLFEVIRLLTVNPDTTPNIVAWAAAFTTYPIYANLALAFFNLLPLPGLDGFGVLASLIRLIWTYPQESSQEISDAPVIDQPISASSERRRPADIHFEVGAKYHSEGAYEDAIARYRQALANDVQYGPAYVNLGLAYLALGQRSQAIHAFRGATRYASDERSKTEAWAHLHQLSQVSPVAPQNVVEESPEAANPWTAVHPTPNWTALWLNSLIVAAALTCIYVYLLFGLVQYFT